MADLLLPNAEGEARHVREDLGVLTECVVVPNAIDVSLFAAGVDRPCPAGSVLCVGRVEPHKNQLGTIRALAGAPGLSLTVVGPAHPHHPGYLEECRRAAAQADNVTLLPAVEHSDLPALYARHRTHVLATWYETTGLVSLEAAASGCTVVFVTHDVEEALYLGRQVVLMAPRPGRIDSIVNVPLPPERHRGYALQWGLIALAVNPVGSPKASQGQCSP